MKNNDNAVIPAARLSKPIDFGTVDDDNWDGYLENQWTLIDDLEDIPINMQTLGNSLKELGI